MGLLFRCHSPPVRPVQNKIISADDQYFSPLFILVFISGNRSDGVPWQNFGNRGLKSAGSERASKKIDCLILRDETYHQVMKNLFAAKAAVKIIRVRSDHRKLYKKYIRPILSFWDNQFPPGPHCLCQYLSRNPH